MDIDKVDLAIAAILLDRALGLEEEAFGTQTTLADFAAAEYVQETVARLRAVTGSAAP